MEAALASPLVRHDYQHSGIYPKAEMNRMGQMLAALSAENGVRAQVDSLGIKFYGDNDSLENLYHFQVFWLSDNSVGVRGGAYNRYAVGLQNTVRLGVFPGWQGGAASIVGDVSGNVEDYRTISGISAALTTYYIIVTLSDSGTIDDSLYPDTLEASAVASYPAMDNTKLIWVLAKVVTDSDGNISTVEQHWNGGDITDYFDIPDQVSLSFVPNDDDAREGRREINGWQETAASDPLNNDEEFMYRPNGGGAPGFALFITAAKAVTDWSGVDLTGAGWTNHDTQISHDHGNLTGLDDDDHDGPLYPYMLIGDSQGVGQVAMYARNSRMGEKNYLGGEVRIETAVEVDTIHNQAGATRIDVDGSTLENDWTTDGTHTAVTQITSPSHHIDAGNEWTATDLLVTTSADARFVPSGSFEVVSSNNFDIEAADWVVSISNALTVDGDTGSNLANVLTHGWVTYSGTIRLVAPGDMVVGEKFLVFS